MSNNKSNNKKIVVKGGKNLTQSQAPVEPKVTKVTPKVTPKTTPKAIPKVTPQPEQKQVKVNSEAKQDKEKEVGDKRTTLTKLTQKAGLNFNVNSFKSWLKRYYDQNEMYAPKAKQTAPKEGEVKVQKEDTDVIEDHIPMFKGAHVALAAAVEVLCQTILKETISQLTKGASGLYDVTRPAIKYAVMLDDDLSFLFSRSLRSFKQNMMYENQFCIPRKEMARYIDSTFGKVINLDQKSYNLLAYLLLSFSMDVASHIFHMMIYANKRTVDFSVVIYALKNLCTGTLEHDIVLKIEDARKLCKEDDENDVVDEKPEQEKQEIVKGKGAKKQVDE